jgi:CRISP-associated protein Cas1
VLVTSNGVLISSDAMRQCLERGIPLHLISGHGELIGSLASPVGNATAATRREQLLAYLDERGRHLVRAVVIGKLRNQAVLLKYAGKYRKETDQETFERVRDAATEIEQLALAAEGHDGPDIESIRFTLLNLEGRGGLLYWQAVARLVRARLPEWPGREHRGTEEPLNAALNSRQELLADASVDMPDLALDNLSLRPP